MLCVFFQAFVFCPHVSGKTLYLKNGQTVLCDYVWVENDLVYAVLKGKQFAISYNKSEIDLAKSAIHSKPPPRQERSDTSKVPPTQRAETPRATSASIPQPFQDLFPITTLDRDEFIRKVDARLGGNPYFRDVNAEAEKEFSSNLPGLWNHVFSGRIPYKGRLTPDQHNFWNDVVNRYRADVWRKKEIEIQQAKGIRNFLLREFEIQASSSANPPKPTRPTQPGIRIYPASPP